LSGRGLDREQLDTGAPLRQLRREGDYWTIAGTGEPFRLRDSKGLRHLDELIRHPDADVHVMSLVTSSGTEGARAVGRGGADRESATLNVRGDLADALGDAGPGLDEQAKAAYRQRIDDLVEEIDEAESFNDPERAARARDEREALLREVAGAVGLGGRARPTGSAVERARLNVTRAIRSAITKVAVHDEVLGRYLDATVRTGTVCRYSPLELEARAGVDQTSDEVREEFPMPALLAERDHAPFVGRAAELRVLDDVWTRARAGQLAVALVGGEPGIGKTRLVGEFARAVRDGGGVVIAGRCDAEALVPYQPFVEAMRDLVASSASDALRRRLGARGGELARLLPELVERLPDLPEPVAGDPDGARYRFFDAVVSLTAATASDHPLTLVLDDLHWADRPTLQLFRHFVRHCQDVPLVLVGTFRETEVRPDHPLAELLGELPREHRAERIALGGLTEDDVVALATAAAPPQAGEHVVRAIYEETQGNPFFVEETIRHVFARGSGERGNGSPGSEAIGVPDSVKDVIRQRVNALSEAAARILEVAAVMGPDFSLAPLEAVSGLDPDPMIDALDEALLAGLVVEQAGALGRYRFRHALVREALYESLSAVRRGHLHAALADAVENRHGADDGPHLSELARHRLASAIEGDAAAAVRASTRAGAYAMHQLAYEDAARHYRDALRALDLHGEPDDRARCEVLLACGDSEHRAGHTQDARRTFLEAANLARRSGLSAEMAQAALGLGDTSFEEFVARMDDELVAHLEEALDLVGSADSTERALLLARLTHATLYSGWTPEGGIALAEDGVEVARRLGDPHALGMALSARIRAKTEVQRGNIGQDGSGPVDFAECLVDADELLEVAVENTDRELALWARINRVVILLELGRLGDHDREIAIVKRIAEELQLPAYRWWPALWDATRALVDGRPADAEELAARALAVGQPVRGEAALLHYLLQLVTLRHMQGRLDEMGPTLDGLVAEGSIPMVRCIRALVDAREGDRAAAQAQFESLAADNFAAVPGDWNWMYATMPLTEVCAYLGDAPAARVLYEYLRPRASHFVIGGWATAFEGSYDGYLGLLASTTRDWESAEQHFRQAIAQNTRLAARPWVARNQADYAVMLLDRGSPQDVDEAAALAGDALVTANEVGMPYVTIQAEQALARARAPRR
jgi:tetratricopeptide (TPR) repeat protein